MKEEVGREDVGTQVRLPANPVASARAAVAIAAMAQGVSPPILPRELAMLDRVSWVLGMVSIREIAKRTLVGATIPLNGEGNITVRKGHSSKEGANTNIVVEGNRGEVEEEAGPSGRTEIQGMAGGVEGMEGVDMQGGNGETGKTSKIEGREDAVGSPEVEELLRLAALFEFLRSGDSDILPADLLLEWDARPDMGLGLTSLRSTGEGDAEPRQPQTADGHEGEIEAEHQVEVGDEVGEMLGRVRDKRRTSMAWNELSRGNKQAGGAQMTWHDLRLALTARAPLNRLSETTRERLERRMVEFQERSERI
ncbi:unnamed protein product, partial [Choristocarpus tenellus]